MILNLKQLINGTKADANDINDISAQVMQAINGNIDSDNIKSDAISRDKLAAGSVTTNKIANEAVTNDKINISHTQTNTTEDSPTFGYFKVGKVLIQYGINYMSFSGTKITFPVKFGGRQPVVILTLRDPNRWGAWVTETAADSFTGKQGYQPVALPVFWVAIGEE